MSEGTPGRAPDADTRTDTGEAQGTTNGRPAPQPVRYGPRNGSPRGGANGRGGGNGSNGRTVNGPTSPQQYRAPQAPRTPTNGSSAAPSTPSPAAPNGRTPNGPSSYTHPRTNGSSARPEPSETDRRVADARTAAAARNASASKVRGGSALSGAAPTGTTTADPAEAASETAVIPVVGADQPATPTTDATQASVEGATADAAADVGSAAPTPAKPERTRGFFSRFMGPREETASAAPAAADAATQATAGDDAASSGAEAKAALVDAEHADPKTADAKPADATSGDVKLDEKPADEERPLTWRDRLGLPPKAPKPQPVVVPDSGPGVPTAAAAAAVAATVAAGDAPPETKASPTGPTTAPSALEPVGRVTPTSPVPAVSPDTVVIPAVDAGTVSPAAPAAAATTQALVQAKPKVGAARRTRKARLRLSRVDPWSVMKTALLFSIAAGIILVVATYGVWSVLNASGLFDAVNDMVKSVVSTPGDTTPFRIEEYVNTQKIIGVAALIAVVDVLIFTALATLGSFLYNLAATVLGGLEVTLAED